jgi:hypothetical protein
MPAGYQDGRISCNCGDTSNKKDARKPLSIFAIDGFSHDAIMAVALWQVSTRSLRAAGRDAHNARIGKVRSGC